MQPNDDDEKEEVDVDSSCDEDDPHPHPHPQIEQPSPSPPLTNEASPQTRDPEEIAIDVREYEPQEPEEENEWPYSRSTTSRSPSPSPNLAIPITMPTYDTSSLEATRLSDREARDTEPSPSPYPDTEPSHLNDDMDAVSFRPSPLEIDHPHPHPHPHRDVHPHAQLYSPESDYHTFSQPEPPFLKHQPESDSRLPTNVNDFLSESDYQGPSHSHSHLHPHLHPHPHLRARKFTKTISPVVKAAAFVNDAFSGLCEHGLAFNMMRPIWAQKAYAIRYQSRLFRAILVMVMVLHMSLPLFRSGCGDGDSDGLEYSYGYGHNDIAWKCIELVMAFMYCFTTSLDFLHMGTIPYFTRPSRICQFLLSALILLDVIISLSGWGWGHVSLRLTPILLPTFCIALSKRLLNVFTIITDTLRRYVSPSSTPAGLISPSPSPSPSLP